MQFQAICSKWNKKLTLSLTASTIEEARSILHKQGYSIIEITESINSTVVNEWNFFFFDARVNGVLQSGKIQSDDIFKAYRKLIEDLKYDVIYIYTIAWMPEDQRRMITAKVRDGYKMYLESVGGNIDDLKPKTQTEAEVEGFSVSVLKELEKYVKIIDDTITKIQNLLIKNHAIITPEQKSLLERIELELVQIKWMRNVGKIQSTLEDALKHIGAVEVEILKKGMIQEKEKFLQETNALLKGIGSSDKILTEEQKQATVENQLKSLFGKIFSKGKEITASSAVEQKKIDTNSFIYYKNKRELDIYKKSASKNDAAIIKALFSFQFSRVKRLLLKRRLLQQNIQIIDNRLNNRNISYTKIVHGMDYYVSVVFGFFDSIASLFVMGLFLYSIAYLSLTSLHSLGILEMNIVLKPILFLVIFSVFVLGMVFIRGWKTMMVVLPVIFIIISFLSVNF